MKVNGFPGLEQLDNARVDLFETSHSQDTIELKIGSWLAHKALTVVCFPANLVGVGIGVAGMVVTACTIGTLKVAIYAATLGNVKTTFPTGFLWFGERTIDAGWHIARNSGELIYDVGDSIYQGYRFVRWVGKKLHIEHVVEEIFRKIGDFFELVNEKIVTPAVTCLIRRLKIGIDKTVAAEKDFKLTGQTPSFIRPLDDVTKENRIDWSSESRSLDKIFKHYAWSCANIPINALVATGAGGAAIVSNFAFVAKVVLCAATTINIPVPTYNGQIMEAAYTTTINTATDLATDVGDGFVLIYKTSEALGIVRVMTTALRVLLYIPEAIFS